VFSSSSQQVRDELSTRVELCVQHCVRYTAARCAGVCRRVLCEPVLANCHPYPGTQYHQPTTVLSCGPGGAAATGSSGSSVFGSVQSFAPEEFTCWQGKRWATKKQGGSTRNKADSKPKYLGTKMSDGQIAFPGQIIVRQRGLRFKAGSGVGVVSSRVASALVMCRLSVPACMRPGCLQCLPRIRSPALPPVQQQKLTTTTINKQQQQSVDHSLFAKAVGTIRFSRFSERLPGRPKRDVRMVSVVPLQEDYSREYAEKAAQMVAVRNEHRKRLLGLRAKFG